MHAAVMTDLKRKAKMERVKKERTADKGKEGVGGKAGYTTDALLKTRLSII